MKASIATAAILAGSANAFTTPVPQTTSTALKATVFEEMPGAVNFLGKKMEFDPVSATYQSKSRYIIYSLKRPLFIIMILLKIKYD